MRCAPAASFNDPQDGGTRISGSNGAVRGLLHRSGSAQLRAGLGLELLIAAAMRHAWMTPVSRPHHETLIRRQSNTSAIPPIPTANKDRSRRLLCANF